MRAERFIVTTRKDGRSRQLIWSGAAPLELDHPVHWRLEQGARGLRIVGPEREIPIGMESLAAGPKAVELSEPGGEPGRGLLVTLRRANELMPAYSVREAAGEAGAEPEYRLCVSHGSGDSLLSFQEMDSRLVGRAEKTRLFTLRRIRDGYRILPRVDDLRVELEDGSGDGPMRAIGRKEGRVFSEGELLRARILWGVHHWWRVTRVPVPQLLVTLDRHESSDINQERAWFRALSRNLALGGAGVLVALLLFLSFRDRIASEVGDPTEPTGPIVSLKKPRQFPVAIEPEAPPAAPRPAPALTHEESVSLKETPSEEKTPPAVAARITPDATLDERLPPPPARAPGAPNHRLSHGGGGRSRHPSRERHPGESYALGTVLTSKGIAVSGDGKLSPNQVERTLAMHLDFFEGCYEGALARNPHLSGPVLVQWVIDPHGKAQDVRIVRSRIRSPGLHQCLINRISGLRFAHPRGGSVLVRYPFSFSVTKI